MPEEKKQEQEQEQPKKEVETQSKSDDEVLGDAGKKALQAERKRAKELEAKLTAASAKLDELNKANETALETAQREAAESKAELDRLRSDAARYRIAAKFNISEEDADLFLTGSDEESLTRQAERLAERAKPTGQPKPDPTQGGNGKQRQKSAAELFAGAFEGIV